MGARYRLDWCAGWRVEARALRDTTCDDDYADTLSAVGAALRLHRAIEVIGGPAGKPKTPPPCVYGCGRRIRVAPSVLTAGPITCGICETNFESETDEETQP